MKTCPACKLNLDDSAFYKNAGRTDGLSVRCKPCYRAYEASPERRAKRTWNTINARAGKQQSYEHVQVRMTRRDFLDWAIPEFSVWMRNNALLCPSLDRIDSSGHYELGNLRVIARGENSALAGNHMNVHAQAGSAWCHVCASYLPVNEFWKSSNSFNGLQHRCKACQSLAIAASKKLRASREALP